jgi:transaldolase
MNELQTLKQWTVVVADTGDLAQVALHRPQDATTNPSLVLKAMQRPESAQLISTIRSRYPKASMDELVDRLLVALGSSILELIPGRVSTEVDARLSFDTTSTIVRAKRLIQMYASEGVDSSRVLIKIASTWEGIQAARQLEEEGIHTNLTLLFNFAQAIACAHANVRLISPFVGRIYDWHKKNQAQLWDESAFSGVNDPGVRSVTNIYQFFKAYGVKTEVMGASFRNTGQIKALAGCDLLTISPELLDQLSQAPAQTDKQLLAVGFERVLTPPVDFLQAKQAKFEPLRAIAIQPEDALRAGFKESEFRLTLNEDAMASEKLAEGIRSFCSDTLKLEQFLRA